MLKFGLIGHPISHSKSPALFKAAYNSNEFKYNLIEAPTCQQAMDIFNKENYFGINITSPFKEEIMNYSTLPDRISSTLSAANILIKRNGELETYNSDYYGVKYTLKEFITDITKKTILIVGAGGAGKAAALATKEMNFKKVLLTNRTKNNAIDFCNKIDIECIQFNEIESNFAEIDIIVYTLPLKIEEFKNLDFSNKILFEANYANPQFADCNANRYIKGEYWLLNQAIAAYELFTNIKPNILNMRKLINI